MNQGNDQDVWFCRLYERNLLPCPYQMGTLLGKGSFGEVYRCLDSFGQELNFACKIINKTNHSNWSATKYELMNEITSLVLINNHKHVTNLISVHETEFYVLIVMEMCHGGDLDKLLSRLGTLTEADAMCLFYQLLEGVAHCHSKGVVNRDIKPGNVLVSNLPPYNHQNPPHLKIADFGLSGISKVENHGFLQGDCGTQAFMAPEVHRYKMCNAKADVWALGIILYMMLKHAHPFELRNGNFEWIPDVWKNISNETKDLLENRLLVFIPQNRSSAQLLLHHPWVARFKN